jgi:hypothetical protein
VSLALDRARSRSTFEGVEKGRKRPSGDACDIFFSGQAILRESDFLRESGLINPNRGKYAMRCSSVQEELIGRSLVPTPGGGHHPLP